MQKYIRKLQSGFSTPVVIGGAALLLLAPLLIAASQNIRNIPLLKDIVPPVRQEVFEKGTILAKFKQGTTEETIKQIISEKGLTQVSATGADGTLVLKVDPNKVKETVTDLKQDSQIAYAEQNYIYQTKPAQGEAPSEPNVAAIPQDLKLITRELLSESTPQETQTAAIDQEILISFKPGTSQQTIDKILQEEGLTKKETIGKTIEIQTSEGETLLKMNSLRAREEIKYAEPNYIVHLDAIPNDPSYSQLWAMKKISAEQAWDVTTGSNNIVVGVLDTGADYTHPDLAANMWSNPGGIWKCEAGTHGYRTIGNWDDDSLNPCDPMDGHSHGTHVSGTIGGVGNNSIGVAGVNWNVRIMALKFLEDRFGSGSISDAARLFHLAVEAKKAGVNIRVLSNSWGGGEYSQTFANAIEEAGANNILVVAAAGNSLSNNDGVMPMYPCAYDFENIICVAASDQGDRLTYFSSYGPFSTDIAAPGISILSSTPGNGYKSWAGTSMATPHVAGAAALVLSAPGNGNLTALEVKNKILNSVDKVPVLSGKITTGGRLNVFKALSASTSPPLLPTKPAACRRTSYFYRDMWQGTTGGEDIRCLQGILNISPDTQVAPSGPGSPGQETTTFDALTTIAVKKFQTKHGVDLVPGSGIGTGAIGQPSRNVLNAILWGDISLNPTPTPVPALTPTPVPPGVSETPWKTNAHGDLTINLNWDITAGYKFIPQVSGQVTKLGGNFNGTKKVSLYDTVDSRIIAEADVTSSDNWVYTSITPVNLMAGRTYLVGADIAGSGGSRRTNISLPATYGNITIQQSCFSESPATFPLNTCRAGWDSMLGQVDIEFVNGI